MRFQNPKDPCVFVRLTGGDGSEPIIVLDSDSSRNSPSNGCMHWATTMARAKLPRTHCMRMCPYGSGNVLKVLSQSYRRAIAEVSQRCRREYRPHRFKMSWVLSNIDIDFAKWHRVVGTAPIVLSSICFYLEI